MAVRNMVRELSYGSPVSAVMSMAAAADGLPKQRTRTARAPINKEWKYGALMQALFDAEREEDYRASDHVSITDHEHT